MQRKKRWKKEEKNKLQTTQLQCIPIKITFISDQPLQILVFFPFFLFLMLLTIQQKKGVSGMLVIITIMTNQSMETTFFPRGRLLGCTRRVVCNAAQHNSRLRCKQHQPGRNYPPFITNTARKGYLWSSPGSYYVCIHFKVTFFGCSLYWVVTSHLYVKIGCQMNYYPLHFSGVPFFTTIFFERIK